MNSFENRLFELKKQIPDSVTLIAVSKTHPAERILEAYQAGHKIFGENRVQELMPKIEALPADIQWHLIGTLQKNKVKYVVGKVELIHSVDSVDLLNAIEKEAEKKNVVQKVLIQVHIAQEETKHGFDSAEIEKLLLDWTPASRPNVIPCGLMGMATFTDNVNQIRSEFRALRKLFEWIQSQNQNLKHFDTLSMGMSSDYKIAIEEGSTMVRIGSALFGSRN